VGAVLAGWVQRQLLDGRDWRWWRPLSARFRSAL